MEMYEKIKPEKGMYSYRNKSFSDILESLDPSENYIGTELEGLDAFSRQLKRFDIKVSGKSSDRIEKFFQTSDSAALFPEYISRAVHTGMESVNIINQMVAVVTNIDGLDYRSIASIPYEDEKKLKRVNEGAFIPQTTVKTQDHLVPLYKRGRMLVSSYEAIRYQRLDLFAVTLRQIGAAIALSQAEDAINTIINGDGNSNPCPSNDSADSENITYDDLINLWTNLSPYELNTMIASTEAIKMVFKIDEMKDASAGLTFHGTGKMMTPFGATLIHVPTFEGNKLIGMDKNCALEMVVSGGVQTEYDKLIDRQLERAAITCTAGFAKIFTDAARVISIA